METTQDSLESQLGQAITDVNVRDVISIFSQLPNYDRLDRTVSWRICQCLHEALRRQKRAPTTKSRREDIDEMVTFAEQLVKLVKKGHLEPDCRAHLHLLSFFNESGQRDAGVGFWQWLQAQDDRYVNSDVYGAAIELLAVNGAPLAELEELYERALDRFPGTFNAYHLSPNAIIPDRNERTTVRGISMVLLQSILTARLLRGASRDAYLTLDTALRLYPTVTPPRFFGLFIEERPLAEAFTVFAMACRGGIAPPYEHLRKLLTTIRASSDLSSSSAHIAALRKMLSVTYLHMGAGGVITSNLVNELVIAMTQILRLQGIAPLDAKHKRRVVDSTTDIIRKALELFAHYGVTPGLSAFNSVITNLAGFGQSKQIISIALKNVASIGLHPNNVTRRSVVTAAGNIGDSDLVAKAWNDLVAAKANDGQRPEATDYHIMAKAAKLSGAVGFAKDACKAMVQHLSDADCQGVYERLNSDENPKSRSCRSALDVTALLSEMEALRADLAVIDERTKDRQAVQDFNQQALPMSLLPPIEAQHLPEPEMRKLYDELTTEGQLDREHQQSALPAASSSPSPVSETGIPLSTLRYENWKTINHLLGWAEWNDQAYDQAVDQAIAAGVAPPPREKVVTANSGMQGVACGLSDVEAGATSGGYEEAADAMQIHRARGEIIRMRGLSPA